MEAMNKTALFQIADSWPRRGIGVDLYANAVQSLIANHTLIVGQSRSGKTSVARRLIEEILTWTDAKVVILDPNADFKLLNELRSDQPDTDFAKHWEALRDEIKIATPDGGAWGIQWGKLSFHEMGEFLRLTPQATFAEYRHLDRHYKYEKEARKQRLQEITLPKFIESKYFDIAVGEELERYRLLLQELAQHQAWATALSKKDLDSLLAEDHKAVVVDLSTDDEDVRTITAARTLESLWSRSEQHRKTFLQNGTRWSGTLVVIDEAHLFAPPSPTDPQKAAVCSRIERIADQGKKLNLYLVAITQQPGKLHKGVLAEFNNRIILRVNERLSLKALEETYGGIRGRYDGALTFNAGEALLEGSLLCDELPPPTTPRGVQFSRGRTREGGGTPEADWAIPRVS